MFKMLNFKNFIYLIRFESFIFRMNVNIVYQIKKLLKLYS